MKRVAACFVVALAGILSASLAYAQGRVSYTISCLGKDGVCAEWHRPGSDVWHQIGGIRIYKDPYPFEFARQCPDGSPIKNNIFIFDPGSLTTGTGYLGCQACIDEANNEHIVLTDENTRIFTDHQAWVRAQQGGRSAGIESFVYWLRL